jgi:pantetheine-phosphate adenylyltransferase
VKVFYPGSFDPLHNGHFDIITRCVSAFSHIVIGVGYNSNKGNFLLSTDERVELIHKTMKSWDLDDAHMR